MPEFCIYLTPLLGISSPHHQFVERMRTEQGMSLDTSTIGPHITVKSPFEVPYWQGEHIGTRLKTICNRPSMRSVRAQVLEPREFAIEGSEDTVLYLPMEGIRVRECIRVILELLEEEFQLLPEPFDGKTPHLTLVKRLKPEDRESAKVIARSIGWPKEVTLDLLTIAHKMQGHWKRYADICLLPAS